MEKKKGLISETLYCIEWEHTGSNRGPSACKADALNQLSYAPKYFLKELDFFCEPFHREVDSFNHSASVMGVQI
jgi:hypothetical protein